MRGHEGAHPCIGALDVCPVVWLRRRSRAAPSSRRLGPPAAIGPRRAAGVPLRGAGVRDRARRERAFFRAGGLAELRRRLETGEASARLRSPGAPSQRRRDAGHGPPTPGRVQRRAEGGGIDDAREIAAGVRESGGGPPGVRAIGIELGRGAPRCRPTSTTRSRCRSPRSPRAFASSPQPTARGWWAPRSSA